MSRKMVFVMTAILGLCVGGIAGAAESFSFDVLNIHYSAGNGHLDINDLFDTDTILLKAINIAPAVVNDPDGVLAGQAQWAHDDENAGIISTMTPSLIDRGGGNIVMNYSYEGNPLPNVWAGQYLSGGMGQGVPTVESHLTATANNFNLGSDIRGVVYYFEVTMFAGIAGAAPLSLEIGLEAGWYSGVMGGTPYDHVLGFKLYVDREGYGSDWEGTPVVLTGYDPATTSVTLSLHAVQQSSTKIIGMASVNGGAEFEVDSLIINENIFSYWGSRPFVAGGLTYVGTEDGDRLVPEPGALALLGIVGIALLRRKRR